jgi:UDP-glucose 4-epimerase
VALDRPGTPKGPWHHFAAIELSSVRGGPGGWKDRITGADAFIHCAGYAHRPVESPEEVQKFFQVNREGTRLVLDACREKAVRRFTYLGTIAAYSWANGKAVAEDADLQPRTAYAQSKLEGELLVTQSDLDWRVVRLATVFGQGDRGNFVKLAKALESRRFVLPGDGEARKSVVPVDLTAKLICDFALRDSPQFRLVNVALPDNPTLAEIVDSFVQTCGFPQPRRLPLLVLRGLARIGDALTRVRPGFPLTTANLSKLTASTEVDVSRLLKLFPSQPWPTFRTSLANHCDWYQRADK